MFIIDKIRSILGSSNSNACVDANSIGDILNNNSMIMTDRNKMSSLLKDYYSHDKCQSNLLLAAYEEGIAKIAKKENSLNDEMFILLRKKLENNRGISEEHAKWSVITWFEIFGKNISISQNNALDADKSLTNKNKINGNSNSSNRIQSINDSLINATSVQNINPNLINSNTIQGNNHPVSRSTSAQSYGQASANAVKLSAIKKLFEASFPHAPYKWRVGTSYYNDNGLDDGSKFLYTQLICNGKAKVDSIIHLSIDSDNQRGWAITDEAFYIKRPNNNESVKYEDIESVFTESFYTYNRKYKNNIWRINNKNGYPISYIDRLDALDPKWNGKPNSWNYVNGDEFNCLANFLMTVQNIV